MPTGRIWILAAYMMSAGAAPAESPASPYAIVSGIVLNDVTGMPVRRAMLTLSTGETPPLDAVTFSESDGTFLFTSLPPGKYHLQANLDGFEGAAFGANSPSRPQATLTLAHGTVRSGITFRLRPLGAISGMVLDAGGDPSAGASIRLLASSYERGKQIYRDTEWTRTDDQGRYLFAEVPPGEYVVAASQSHVVRFYPGVSRLSYAAAIPITSGQDVDGIDFSLAPTSAATLRGRVAAPANLPGSLSATISIYPADAPQRDQAIATASAEAPDFRFEIPSLETGSYLVVAALATPGRDYRTAEPIDLAPGGTDLTLTLHPAIDLHGRLDLEGGPRLAPFRVTLSSGDTPRVPAQPSATVQPDGSFTLRVLPGIWDIGVTPLPPGYYLKAMRLGDQDVLAQDMTITPATHAPLQILVSSRGATVNGVVTVPAGVVRSARAAVVLAPSGAYEHVAIFYALTDSDDAGHFEFDGVAPGRYRLYAFEVLEPRWDDPRYLERFAGAGELIEAGEGRTVSRQVALIPSNTETVP